MCTVLMRVAALDAFDPWSASTFPPEASLDLGYSVAYGFCLFGFWAPIILTFNPKNTYLSTGVTEQPRDMCNPACSRNGTFFLL